MSEFEKIMNAVITGDISGLLPPQSNIEKYWCKAIGAWDGPLPAPVSRLDGMFYQIAKNGIGGGGGADLPALANPATAALILEAYEAINQNGAKVTGTMPNNGAVSERLTRSDTSYTVPKGFHDGNGKVYVDVQEKTVTPTSEAQEVTPDTGKLLGKVIVEAAQAGGADFSITDASYLFYDGARIDCVEGLVELCKGITSTAHMFDDLPYAVAESYPFPADLSKLDTSKVTSMEAMFRNCFYALAPDVSGFDTSNVTNMENMFLNCDYFNNLDVSNWDTSKVTNMKYLFAGCKRLTEIDLTNWDTSKVSYMNYMFENCTALTTAPSLNLSTVTRLDAMFSNCTNMTGEVVINSMKCSGYGDMFKNCKKLEGIIGIGSSLTSTLGLSSNFFPYGTSTSPSALKRVTFHEDLVCTGIANLKLQYCSFDRDGMVEFFQSLPNISGSTASSSYKTITITGNPCVTDGTLLAEDRLIATQKGWQLVE